MFVWNEPPLPGRPLAATVPGAGGRAWAFWPLWLAAVLLPLGILGGGALWSWQQVTVEAHARLARTVDMLHEHALRAFEAQDAVLAAVQGRTASMSWEEIAASRELWEFLRSLDRAAPNTSNVGMIAPDGRLMQIATGPFPAPPGNFSDRDYVAAQRRAERNTPFVGETVVARVTGQVIIAHSRPRLGPDRRPDGGTLWATFRVTDFSDFYASIVETPGDAVVLLREDGAILARYPPLPAPEGQRLPPGAVPMQAVAQAGRPMPDPEHPLVRPPDRVGFAEGPSPLDGQWRVFAGRQVAGLPVAIVYGLHPSVLRAAWLRRVAVMAAVSGAAAALLLWLTWLVQAQAGREFRALERERAEAERRAEAEAVRASAEAALRDGQRLEALGQIAAGVAHDFRNVVQAVQGGTRLIERAATLGDPARVQELARMVAAAAGRGAELTGRMLDFARQDGKALPVTDPREAIVAAGGLLERTLGAGYRVRCELANSLPAEVRGGHAELEAALVNLAVNARDAMPGGGEVAILGAGENDPPGLLPGRYAQIAVVDTGVGMDAATLARATDAFFTTKPRGKGTGLGLATARAFAEGAGGALRIESEPGRGTTVTLWLAAAGPVGTAAPEPG